MVNIATINDLDGILELLKQVNLVHHNIRPDLFKIGTKYNKSDLESILKDDTKRIFVYKDNNNILGHAFINILEETNMNLFEPHKTIYIDDICVDEFNRGKHVGKALYEYVLKFAKDINAYNITLNVWTGNDNAYKFYESLGFKEYKKGMEIIIQ